MSDCKECISNNIWIKFLPEIFFSTCLNCDQKGIRQTKITVYGVYFVIFTYLLFFFLAYYVFIN